MALSSTSAALLLASLWQCRSMRREGSCILTIFVPAALLATANVLHNTIYMDGRCWRNVSMREKRSPDRWERSMTSSGVKFSTDASPSLATDSTSFQVMGVDTDG